MDEVGYILHCDKYAINMMYAHWKEQTHNQRCVFDMFFRKNPFQGGYVVFAGLERLVSYLRELKFGPEEIEYLRMQEEGYEEGFLQELTSFRFTGDLASVREGEIVFPGEPLVRVKTRVFEALLIEAALLNFINFQSLIATKAARIKQIAGDDVLLEFGTRRAQEMSAAIWGARATYIAGFNGTSNMLAGIRFGLPVAGTHSHAWVQNHQSEYEAFAQYAKFHPDHTVLLVDTYDTLRSGVPNAIKVGKQMESEGHRLKGIRLDSGDLAYLSRKARAMLDEAGLSYVKIVASNDLDENILADLKRQGAAIDSWGIGTKLITAQDDPVLGGVYKVAAKETAGGEWIPSLKISANPEKVTTPGIKSLYRIVNRLTGKAEGDYICLEGETIDETQRLKLFDPIHTYLHKFITNYTAMPLLHPVFEGGEQVYELPSLEEMRQYHRQQLGLFWDEYLRRLNPERFPVSLSQKLWSTKASLLEKWTVEEPEES